MMRDYYVSLSFPPFVDRYHRRRRRRHDDDDENICMYTRNKLFTPIYIIARHETDDDTRK